MWGLWQSNASNLPPPNKHTHTHISASSSLLLYSTAGCYHWGCTVRCKKWKSYFSDVSKREFCGCRLTFKADRSISNWLWAGESHAMMENNKKKPLLVCQISENGLCCHDRACGPPLWAPLLSTVISRAGPREYHWCLSLCPAVLWYGSARLKRKGAECGGREQLHVCRDVRRYTGKGEALRRMDGFCWRCCCCCDSQAVCKAVDWRRAHCLLGKPRLSPGGVWFCSNWKRSQTCGVFCPQSSKLSV